jgi:hypothetical protein
LRLRKAKTVKWVCLEITESGAAEKVEEALLGTVNEVIGEYDVSYGTGEPASVFVAHSDGFANLDEDRTEKDRTIVFSLAADDEQTIRAGFQVGEETRTRQLQDPPYTVDLSRPRARRLLYTVRSISSV